MKEWLAVIGYGVMGLILLMLVISFFGLFVMIGLAVIGVVGVAWLLGLPIKVTRNGKTIGYYRRTVYTPVNRPVDQPEE